MRKFTAATMREFGVGKKLMEERILEETEVIKGRMERLQTAFFPRDILLYAVSNIISWIIFGQR